MSNEKRFAIIGVGNCGCQIANLAEKMYDTLFDSIYMNTSKSDLAMVKTASPLMFKIGNDDVEGSGKNRDDMKHYFRESATDIMNQPKLASCISAKKHVFVVGSTAGGSGSGASLVVTELMRHIFKNVNFIPIGVLPNKDASLLELGNTLDYLEDLYEKMDPGLTYMLYDNSMTDKTSSVSVLEYVNRNIVEDLRILTGIDNYPTPYDSIDTADMDSILCTPGRIIVTRLKSGLDEKSLEDNTLDDMIIKAIKRSCHVETDRNKKVVRRGIITYLTESASKLYNPQLDKLKEFMGEPIWKFYHNAINANDDNLSFLYLVASGLSPINDRAQAIAERIDKLKSMLPSDETGRYKLAGNNPDLREERAKNEKVSLSAGDLDSIMSKF